MVWINLAWLTAGTLVGVGLTMYVLPGFSAIRGPMLKKILRTNRELGWLLIQKGNNYELEPVAERNGDTVWVEDEETGDAYDDPSGLMQTLYGVPIGMVREPFRPIGDVATADAGNAMEARPDGGELKEDDQLTPEQIRDRMIVGYERGEPEDDTFVYVNPYKEEPNTPELTDLRNISQAISFAGKSDTPRKAAQNAKEAERAFERFGSLKSQAGLLAAFILGAITTEYIAGSSGAGGGGISVGMPWMHLPDLVAVFPF